MQKKLSLLLTVLVLAVLIAGAYVLYDKLSEQVDAPQLGMQGQQTTESGATEAQKTEAPDFTVYDMNGNAVKLSDYRGKPVVLNFWASWCGPCKNEMPDFEKAYQKYGAEIHFLMVNATDGYQETKEKAAGLIADKGYSFPVFFDTDTDAAAVYGISALPTTFFIDADGYLIAYATGALDEESLEKGIGMIR